MFHLLSVFGQTVKTGYFCKIVKITLYAIKKGDEADEKTSKNLTAEKHIGLNTRLLFLHVRTLLYKKRKIKKPAF